MLGSAFIVAGCEGRQSALAPAGAEAQAIFVLFLTMLGGAAILWLGMNAMYYWFTWGSSRDYPERFGRQLIIYGGLVMPVVILSGLLVWGLSLLPQQRAAAEESLEIFVSAEQWWWRVEYLRPGASEPVVSANEVRFPAGQRTEIRLTSDRFIHSFWIPALGGKVDMFPGRETHLSLEPETPGVYRGQCAEFCGASHAWMAFEAVVMPPDDFVRWLEAEAGDASSPATPAATRGREIFVDQGCGACHTIRGTNAVGQVGPDLTHVGSRHSIGAGRLGTRIEDFARWIAHTDDLKPDVTMPAFPELDSGQLHDLALYLKELK